MTSILTSRYQRVVDRKDSRKVERGSKVDVLAMIKND